MVKVEAKGVGLEDIRKFRFLQCHYSVLGNERLHQFVAVGLQAIDIGRQERDVVCVRPWKGR
jgi:hypothetical protein